MGETTVVVLGKGPLAIRVCDWLRSQQDWWLAGIVPVVPEPTWTDSLGGWAAARDLPLVESGDYTDLAAHGGGRIADLGISVFYDRILPPAFIARFGRIVNIHNGPLPRYRGVSPINWALKNGESSHGVTIHEITPGIDDGPIVAQLNYSIYSERDEVEDVYRRALAYGWALFEQTMPILDRIEPTPQEDRLATYHGADDNELLGERRSFNRQLSRAAATPA